MKKILLIPFVLLIGCKTIEKVDTSNISTVNKKVLFNTDTIATLSNIEYSLDNGKFVKEMTFRLTDMKHGDKVKSLIYYMRKEHKGWDIEVDVPIEDIKLK